MATHSSILPWKVPWIEEPGGLQSMGLQRVGHNLATKQQQRYSRNKEDTYTFSHQEPYHVKQRSNTSYS